MQKIYHFIRTQCVCIDAIALFIANTMNAHFPDHFYGHASGITIKLCNIMTSNFHLPIYLGYSLTL